jgi:hypothetical protein
VEIGFAPLFSEEIPFNGAIEYNDNVDGAGVITIIDLAAPAGIANAHIRINRNSGNDALPAGSSAPNL